MLSGPRTSGRVVWVGVRESPVCIGARAQAAVAVSEWTFKSACSFHKVKYVRNVEVGGQTVTVSHPDKVLFPATGFTKGDLVDYYLGVSEAMLPHLWDRPVSLIRHPQGVDKEGFFAKQAPGGMPPWVRTVNLPSPGSSADRDTIDYVVVDNAATLVWLAHLSAIELHTPQWHLDDFLADRIVFDLDPGENAGIPECCDVALLVREVLADDGLEVYPKTSGGKGLHLYAPVDPVRPSETHAYAKALAQRLERENPELAVSSMRKADRRGKVLIDWSQNNAAKTTVCSYSVRAKDRPVVSTPLSWRQVQSRAPKRYAPADVLRELGRIRERDVEF